MSMAERSDKILEIKDGQFVEQQEASLLGN
jgi:hypothetical protein